MNTENDNCDGTGPHTQGEVRSLPTGGMTRAILCRACFLREMNWRRERYQAGEYRWPTHFWDELEVYPKPDVAQEAARMRRRHAKTIGL